MLKVPFLLDGIRVYKCCLIQKAGNDFAERTDLIIIWLNCGLSARTAKLYGAFVAVFAIYGYDNNWR